MYTVNLHYDVEGWAYYHRCKALAKYAPQDFKVNVISGQEFRPTECDLALQLCFYRTEKTRKEYLAKGFKPLLVAGLNIGWQDGTKKYANLVNKHADHVIVNSRLCYEGIQKHIRGSKKFTQISNGVDTELFRDIGEQEKIYVLWTGSEFWRNLKRYDSILIPLKKKLELEGIKCDFRLVDVHGKDRITQDQMVKWYQKGAVYVCASKSEGTPNPALEAAACGCVIVSTPVGNMPELIESGVNGYLVRPDVTAFYVRILDALDRRKFFHQEMKKRIKSWSWERRAFAYYSLFRRLIERRLGKISFNG